MFIRYFPFLHFRGFPMARPVHGELIPLGGGDSIPLTHKLMTVGRRESCDICLKYQNVSGLHCEFAFNIGYWNVKDLGSSNGVKVNDHRLTPQIAQVLKPGDIISIASFKYKLMYEVEANFAEMGTTEEDVMGRSLLEKAGLERPKKRVD